MNLTPIQPQIQAEPTYQISGSSSSCADPLELSSAPTAEDIHNSVIAKNYYNDNDESCHKCVPVLCCLAGTVGVGYSYFGPLSTIYSTALCVPSTLVALYGAIMTS